MSGERRWMPTSFMPTMLLPERWADDVLARVMPPSERGPWASITCGDIETRDEVLAALRAASRLRSLAAIYEQPLNRDKTFTFAGREMAAMLKEEG